MGQPKTPHFYDFGTFERVPEPQNQVFLFWRHQDIKKRQKLYRLKQFFTNIETLETQYVDNFGKDGHRKMMKIRLDNYWQSWIWDKYLSKHEMASW